MSFKSEQSICDFMLTISDEIGVKHSCGIDGTQFLPQFNTLLGGKDFFLHN